jgi:NAD(P)-dependent dehydrogenase (short-subunit alcohol dehydrogenase family)
VSVLAAGILRGKTAWITGGGTGLGAAMARRFAALGAKVALSGRRPEPIEAVASELSGIAAPCDVRDPAQVDAALARIVKDAGPIDILVNNAAGNFLCPSEDLSPNGFDAVVRIVLHDLRRDRLRLRPPQRLRQGRRGRSHPLARRRVGAPPDPLERHRARPDPH